MPEGVDMDKIMQVYDYNSGTQETYIHQRVEDMSSSQYAERVGDELYSALVYERVRKEEGILAAKKKEVDVIENENISKEALKSNFENYYKDIVSYLEDQVDLGHQESGLFYTDLSEKDNFSQLKGSISRELIEFLKGKDKEILKNILFDYDNMEETNYKLIYDLYRDSNGELIIKDIRLNKKQ